MSPGITPYLASQSVSPAQIAKHENALARGDARHIPVAPSSPLDKWYVEPVHRELKLSWWIYLDGDLQGITRHIAFNSWKQCQYTV
jgi:hypothetical protein